MEALTKPLPRYNCGQRILYNRAGRVLVEARFIRWLDTGKAQIYHAGSFKLVKQESIRTFRYLDTYSQRCKPGVLVRVKLKEGEELLGKLVSRTKNRKWRVLVVEKHPIWHGCLLKPYDYVSIIIVEEQPNGN